MNPGARRAALSLESSQLTAPPLRNYMLSYQHLCLPRKEEVRGKKVEEGEEEEEGRWKRQAESDEGVERYRRREMEGENGNGMERNANKKLRG